MHQTKKLLDMLHEAIEAEAKVIVDNGLTFPLPAEARDALMQLEWLFHIYTSGCEAVCDTMERKSIGSHYGARHHHTSHVTGTVGG